MREKSLYSLFVSYTLQHRCFPPDKHAHRLFIIHPFPSIVEQKSTHLSEIFYVQKKTDPHPPIARLNVDYSRRAIAPRTRLMRFLIISTNCLVIVVIVVATGAAVKHMCIIFVPDDRLEFGVR